jgi:hypothetical protein
LKSWRSRVRWLVNIGMSLMLAKAYAVINTMFSNLHE